MSNLQEVHYGGKVCTTVSSNSISDRVFENPKGIEWFRTDWGQPVGTFNSYRITSINSIRGFTWELIEIPTLWLRHRATMLLLQGQKLSDILIPNHEIRSIEELPTGYLNLVKFIGHILLRVDPWEYWRSRPLLTGLKLARLGDIPDNLSSEKVLEILVAESSS
jgi:hypothetical protein